MNKIPLLLATVIALCLCCTPASAADRPNVLFIAVDDLGNTLGCYGDPQVKSPNIDRLAQRGVRFDRAYCQYPVCNPSRVSFLTGLRPDSSRVLGNNLNFRKVLPDITTLPQLFRENGYFTASLGKIFHRGLTMEDTRGDMDDPKSWDVAKYFQATKLGMRGEGRNLTGGKLKWCHWLAAEGADEDQPDGQIAAEAIRLMEEKRDQPFFIGVGFHKPHDPFIAPKKYFDLYSMDSLKLPSVTAPLPTDPPLALTPILSTFAEFTDKERLEFMRAYFAGTSFIDAQLGKILDALDRLGLAEKTIIVLLGDHGYHLGERGWWNKNTLFELSSRAPLIIAAPGRSGNGKASPRVVEFLDVYPTLTALAGLQPKHDLQGRSLVPLLDEPAQASDRPAYTQVQRGGTAGRSVRTERWRYTEWQDGKRGVELYDHSGDPHELKNLAKDPAHRDTVEELSGLLRAGK